METYVKDWQIVEVFDAETVIGDVLWGIVEDDQTYRFYTGDYVCSSKITRVDIVNHVVITASKSIYKLVGEGIKSKVAFSNFELLRNGFSPQEIEILNQSPTTLH
ncbi:hypothetical protein [Thalassotalea sp. PP2-459]|uniref:hypothetical protein n=1 Tax=Thalassotalea sp. PP2-459 TaxID=1742724 RepID=UPI0009459312|nr:hypothetical protein [Thalassotalea sp. PP2-459]OKY24970.1 hypothetical protein BI291_04435 [Thalassotalea sp. PP2-459]